MRTKLGSLTSIKTGKLDANASSENGVYPFFTCAAEPLKIDSYSYDCECTLVAGNGDLNVKYYNGKFDAYQRTYIIESKDKSKLTVPYLYYFLESYIETLRNQSIGGIIKYIKLGNLTNAPIPVLSIEEQNKIVKTLDKAKSIITHRRTQLEKLDLLVKARFVEMFGDCVSNNMNWKVSSLESVCDKIYGGGTPSKSHIEYYENGDIPWVSSKDMKYNIITDSQIHINELGVRNSTVKMIPVNSVIMVIRSGILKHTLPIAVNAVPITINQDLKAFIPNNLVLSIFLAIQFKMLEKDILSGVRAVTADNIEFNSLKQRNVIVPPLNLQTQFAAFVEQIDKSKVAVQKALDEAQLLFDSLMQEYFG